MIPEGWKKKSLEDVAEIRTGLAKGKKTDEAVVLRPYLRVANVQDGYLDLQVMKDIEVREKDLGRYALEMGDVVLTEGGDFDKLGRGAVWQGQIAGCLHQNHVFAVRTVRSKLLPDFFAAQSGSHYGKSYYLSCAKRSTNLASINSSQLKQFPVLVPPLREQQRIADTLKTWDRAIETVEALIANARAQKQALMQQLLPQGTTPPKKRLPGFSGEWHEARLGSIVKEVSRDVDWDDAATYKLISVRRRSEGIFHRESLLGHEILTKVMKVALRGDFLISKMQIVHGASALVKADFDGFNISGSYIALVPKDQTELDIEYFDWNSRTPYFYKLTYISSYGVHIEKMTFNLKSFLKQTILMPPSKAEQSAIVKRLNSAEALIGVYQQQADALREEKAALMQQLLTGKRRVKLPESEVA